MVATRRDQRCTEHSEHIDYPAASAALAPCWIASAVLKAGARVGRLLARPAMRRFDLGEEKGRETLEWGRGIKAGGSLCGDARCGS